VTSLRHPILHIVLGLALGGVFLYASHDKILQPAEFAKIVYHYQVVGPSQTLAPWVPNLFAVTLPWIELVAGACLIVGLWRREAAAVSAVLLLAFVLAVSSALLRGIDIQNCGCFSVTAEGRSAGLKLILGDLALLAGALILALGPRPAAVPSPAAPRVDNVQEPA
jgi:putative oxidoreductase